MGGGLTSPSPGGVRHRVGHENRSYPAASRSLADEIGRLRTGPGEGSIAVDGATQAAGAARPSLIDKYRVTVSQRLWAVAGTSLPGPGAGRASTWCGSGRLARRGAVSPLSRGTLAGCPD